MSLSDLPDEILNLISIRLNGFDNCSLWMASDSKMKERLVNNIITDFDIKYTIPGRYLWPGNFLKQLSKLSRLSLVVDDDVYHLPIKNIELFPISTLKYLKLDFTNASEIFVEQNSISCNNPTTGLPTSYAFNNSYKCISLKDYYPNLEYFKMINPWLEDSLPIDFLGFLPQTLHTLSMPQKSFEVDLQNPRNHLNTSMEKLPQTLTSLNIRFGYLSRNKTCLDFSRLPPNLTSLTTDAIMDDQTYHMIPKSLKKLFLLSEPPNLPSLFAFLPTGLESILVDFDEDSTNAQLFTHLQNLESIYLKTDRTIKSDDLITSKCPPKLRIFSCNNLVLTDLPPTRLFSNCLTRLNLSEISGISAEFISSLPQSLTKLKLTKDSSDLSDFPFFSLLPRKLTSFVTNFDIVENVSLLPESLTYLWLSSLTSSHSHFDRLPPKLETFKADMKLPRSIIKQLPTSLKELNMYSDEVVDDDIIRALPRGLEELSIWTVDNVSDSGAADLPQSLQKLVLFQNTAMTDDSIIVLPRNLKLLNLPRNRNFSDKCVQHLPRNLTSLYLSEVTKITSRSCRDLPKYLRILLLPKCKDWDPHTLMESKDSLPQHIQNLKLGNQKSIDTWLA